MRSLLGLAASALAGLAAMIASLDGDADIVPFFVGLTFLGGLEAWAAHSPYEGPRRRTATGVALVWLVAAVWVGALLLVFVAVSGGGSRPPPGPEATYLGLTATVYHMIGLYGGMALMLVSAFAPEPWFRSRSERQTQAPSSSMTS